VFFTIKRKRNYNKIVSRPLFASCVIGGILGLLLQYMLEPVYLNLRGG
jgi:hypothetical protein